MSLKKVVAAVKKYKNFLITTHTNPEGDALGSELAFYKLLKALGKSAIIINEDDTPHEYAFLPGVSNIKKLTREFQHIRFDCLVTLDCSDLHRCKRVSAMNVDNKPILNIDHHISNEQFGSVNWVEPTASSCAEMVYRLYKKLHVPFCRDTAMFLYVGIFTDTGSFRYSNTTTLTHKIVSELLRFNLDVPKIYNNVYGNIPFQDIRLLLKILPTIKLEPSGKLAWYKIKRSLLENRKISFDLSEYILTFARNIKGIEVTVLFKENLGIEDEIRVNLRSQGKVDVNKIATFFGGGGHKTAAGITMHGKIDTVRRKVLAKIRENLK